ncbi:MAG: adenosine deaminase family protein [Alphaproteobacteria bacterium]|nr:adenosine deaminase family protein [Alphaproteobacteria bacterium]MCB9792339.1 adenosine deaminase family protein [Alphaproteobacteria bacterium]
MVNEALLRALPKADLHVHLDGSLRLGTLIELARERGVALPSDTEAGLRALVFKDRYASLSEYLAGFGLTNAVLRDAEALERVSYELAWDNILEGVRYVEVRFAPQLHVHAGLSFEAVLRAVEAGLARAAREHAQDPERQGPAFRYGMIVCALRKFTPAFGQPYARLFEALPHSRPTNLYALAALDLAQGAVRARDDLGLPVVAFDLAGEEAGYPASDYAEAFRFAQEHFLHKTVHAGEAYGPESIYQAVSVLDADRVGHGLHLFSPEAIQDPKVYDPPGYVNALIEYISDRRITLEVCITSNLQTTPSIGDVRNHPFRRMLDAKLSATLCTDNRLVSHTTVTKEYALAVEAFDMSAKELRNTVIYGFKRSFFPGSYLEKRVWVRELIDHYDALWAAAHPEDTP